MRDMVIAEFWARLAAARSRPQPPAAALRRGVVNVPAAGPSAMRPSRQKRERWAGWRAFGGPKSGGFGSLVPAGCVKERANDGFKVAVAGQLRGSR
jgi:hypothetical protein